MSFDRQRDNTRHNVRQPSILCGDAVLDLDSHGPRERSCSAATLQRSMTAPERWNMGPTLHDTDVAMDQRSRIPWPHGSLMISQTDAVLHGSPLPPDPSGQDPSSTPTRWIIVLSLGLPSSPCIAGDRSGADQGSAKYQARRDRRAIRRGEPSAQVRKPRWAVQSPEAAVVHHDQDSVLTVWR
jgi:hypothetical protein